MSEAAPWLSSYVSDAGCGRLTLAPEARAATNMVVRIPELAMRRSIQQPARDDRRRDDGKRDQPEGGKW